MKRNTVKIMLIALFALQGTQALAVTYTATCSVEARQNVPNGRTHGHKATKSVTNEREVRYLVQYVRALVLRQAELHRDRLLGSVSCTLTRRN